MKRNNGTRPESGRKAALVVYALAAIPFAAGVSAVVSVVYTHLYRYGQFEDLIGKIDDHLYEGLTVMSPAERGAVNFGIVLMVIGLALMVTMAVAQLIRRQRELERERKVEVAS